MWSVRCTKSNQIAVLLTPVSSCFYQFIRQQEKLMGWHPSGVTRTRIRGIRVIQVKMTEKSGEIQGKLDLVLVSGEFSSYLGLSYWGPTVCIYWIFVSFCFTCFSRVLSISRWKSNVWICLSIISHSAMQLSTEIYNIL